MPMNQLASGMGRTRVVDKRKIADANNPISNTSRDSCHSNAAKDTRLLAIGGVYTAAYVQILSDNDKVYALRVNDEGAGI